MQPGPRTQRYRIEHLTRYGYGGAVSQSWQLAHLTPRELPWQHVFAHALEIDPPPEERTTRADCHGNTVTHFAVHGPHRKLRVDMRCEVEVGDRPAPPAGDDTWEAVRDRVRHEPALDALEPAAMCAPSPLVPWSKAARAYAAPSLAPGRPWLEAVTDLMHRIHGDFDFVPGATTVTTSIDEVLGHRRGVCQDFAHLMIGCLRAHGLPARYVSGYLLTQPPPGRPRLLGADATHAWAAVYAPGAGWLEFDPTNDALADRRYVTLAWGADFGAVVPLRGVVVGGRRQDLHVEVSVVPVAEPA